MSSKHDIAVKKLRQMYVQLARTYFCVVELSKYWGLRLVHCVC